MVPQLKRLALDSRYTFNSASTQQLWAIVLRNTQRSHAPLESLTLKCPDRQPLNKDVLDLLLSAHSGTLRTLRLVNCDVDLPSIHSICLRCKKLEVLAINIPVDGLVCRSFIYWSRYSTFHKTDLISSISSSKSLKKIVDVPPTMHVHPSRPALNREAVREIMKRTNVHEIVCFGRTWTVSVVRYICFSTIHSQTGLRDPSNQGQVNHSLLSNERNPQACPLCCQYHKRFHTRRF